LYVYIYYDIKETLNTYKQISIVVVYYKRLVQLLCNYFYY